MASASTAVYSAYLVVRSFHDGKQNPTFFIVSDYPINGMSGTSTALLHCVKSSVSYHDAYESMVAYFKGQSESLSVTMVGKPLN